MAGETWPARRVDSFDDIERAGDYALGSIVEYPDDPERRVEKRAVWFLLPLHEGATRFDRPTPGSGIHGVYEPPWTFRECDDGSIEVRASIARGRGEDGGEYFHGYLDEGNVWRSC